MSTNRPVSSKIGFAIIGALGLMASSIALAQPSPLTGPAMLTAAADAASASPTPTSSASPRPSASATPSGSPSPSASSGPSASPSPSARPTPGASPTPSATPSVSPSPSPSPTATPVDPRITVEPSSGLADGQYVKLTFKNFPIWGQDGFAFRQCIDRPKVVATDCTDTNHQVTGITNEQNSGSTYLPVYADGDPLLASADGKGSIRCDADHPCVIAAMRNVTQLGTAILEPLTFAKSPDACPQGGNGILGSGSATAYRAIYTWQSNACLPPTNLAVSYTYHNSHDGWTNFEAGLTDFGVTGPFPPPPDAPADAPTYRYAPITASGLVLAYRMYDGNGAQITSLTLTPSLIAQIFTGQIPNWNIPAIKQLNPQVTTRFPPRVIPFARAEFSAETLVFTSWLAKAAPGDWVGIDGKTPIGAQQVYPSDVLGPSNYRLGSRAVALAVVDPTTDWTGQGNIAFMDTSTAAFYGLPTVTIKQSDGSTVAATPATIAEAIKAATTNADGSLTTDYAKPHPNAYPMPIPSYMLAPTSKTTPDKGAIIAAFLKYAVQAGQRELPPGYAPLPTNLTNESLAVAGLIPGGGPAPTTTPTPTPSATPRPTAIPTASPTTSARDTSNPLPLLGNLPDLNLPSGQSNAATTTGSVPAAAAASAAPAVKLHLRPAAVPLGQGTQLAALIEAQDSTSARYLLPALALIGLLSLLGGAAVQLVARRRSR